MKKDSFKNDPVVKRLEQAKRVAFHEVQLKSAGNGRTLTGDELKKWLQPLMHDHYSNEDFAARVHYRFDTQLPIPVPMIRGTSGTVSPQEISFVYLDVGAWVGSASGPWGKAGKIQRDFGVICGPLVLLCSFTYAHKGSSCPAWTKADKTKEPFKSVNALLQKLPTESTDLGEVVVRDMEHASAANPRWPENPDDWVIHVVVGDMHIPVVDRKIQTYGGAAKRSKELDPQTDAETGVVTTEIPARVPRLGRVDIRPLEDLVKLLVGPNDEDGTAGLRKLVELVSPLAQATVVRAFRDEELTTREKLELALESPALVQLVARALGIGLSAAAALIEESWRRGDWDGVKDGTMKVEEAERWYEYYRTPKEGKPADIFEGAGVHFLQFMNGIAAYVDKQGDHLPVKFLQLGDMLDFWVGFSCHYEPSADAHTPLHKVHEHGERMVKTWAANLFGNTDQGILVANAIQVAEKKHLGPVYLYGNHDNYLGAKFSVSYPMQGQKTPVRLAKRKAKYHEQGLFMEHGHQWEPSNADSKGLDPLVSRYLLGTSSPLGMLVTQAAFIRSGPVRRFEGQAAGLVAEFTGTYGQRMDQIVGAARRFWEHSGDFYCYVMGHTHSACLSQIVLSTKYDGTLIAFRKERENDPRTRLVFTTDGIEIKDDVHVKFRQYNAAEVRVDWMEMLGAKEHEWVSLEDPMAPVPGHLDRAVKGLAMANHAGPHGYSTFQAPPGLYVARFYLSREATDPFRETRNRIAVAGISIEGGEPNKNGVPVFEFDGKTFTRPIFLRWAYDPKHFDDSEAFFALYREHEPIESTSILSNNPPHPINKFVVVQHNGPMFGRYCLSRAHPVSWDFHERTKKPIGVWVVRAFMDQAAKKPIGMAKFEVREAKHGKSRRHR